MRNSAVLLCRVSFHVVSRVYSYPCRPLWACRSRRFPVWAKPSSAVGFDVVNIPLIVALIYPTHPRKWRQRRSGSGKGKADSGGVECQVRFTHRVQVHQVFLNMWGNVHSACRKLQKHMMRAYAMYVEQSSVLLDQLVPPLILVLVAREVHVDVGVHPKDVAKQRNQQIGRCRTPSMGPHHFLERAVSTDRISSRF